ncbi:cytochrome c [uncultured Roseibium sp.]|uniref:c-type cytochrome n=1 Tax=uncultured Roseibium sp. TaxID=1936171 RepID=UPI00260E2FC0|nr:cytochrome c [uncultured Roseibium sp.]
MKARTTAVVAAGFALILAYTLATLFKDKGDHATPAQGMPMVTITVPELSENAVEGQKLFQENCSVCHGDNAVGREGFGPPLVHKIYEPGHHSDGSFFVAAKQGVRAHHWSFGDMPPVQNTSMRDVERIVVFVRELQRANGIH